MSTALVVCGLVGLFVAFWRATRACDPGELRDSVTAGLTRGASLRGHDAHAHRVQQPRTQDSSMASSPSPTQTAQVERMDRQLPDAA